MITALFIFVYILIAMIVIALDGYFNYTDGDEPLVVIIGVLWPLSVWVVIAYRLRNYLKEIREARAESLNMDRITRE